MITSEILYVDEASVFCSGKNAPLDHPKVYLMIDKEVGNISCPYCSRKFVL